MGEQKTAHVLYKKLLRLYPRRFGERLGESKEQTFNDLYKERKHLTIKGRQGEINTLGRIVVYGGLLLLTVALALSLQPILKKDGSEQKRGLYVLNLIVGTVIFLLIIFTWGGLMLEEIYCLQGIRCD